MDILNNLNVDGKIKGLGEVEDGSGNKLSDLPGKMDDSQLVTSWQATPDDTHVPSEKLTKDSLDGKVDKLVTKPTAGTYTSVTINAEGQVTGGSNPTTLAGYGITDAVTLGTGQTITGDKTFEPSISGAVAVAGLGNANNKRPLWRCKFTGVPSDSAPATAVWGGMQFTDVSNAEIGSVTFNRNATASYINLFLKNVGGANTSLRVWKEDGGDAYATCPSRTYDSANTDDVVTISTLNQNMTVDGVKTFIRNVVTNNSTYSVSRDVDLSAITSSTLIGQLSISAKNGDADLEMARFQARRYGSRSRVQMQCANLTGEIASLYLQSYDNLSGTVTHISAQKERTLMVTNTDGTAVYTAPDQRAYNSANTTDIVTIGSLASNPNVVHTTGNETIGGYKTFNNSIWKTHANLTYGKPSADFSIDLFSIRDPLDTSIQMTALYITYKTDGSVVLNGITRKSDGTYNTAVDIATLRSAY